MCSSNSTVLSFGSSFLLAIWSAMLKYYFFIYYNLLRLCTCCFFCYFTSSYLLGIRCKLSLSTSVCLASYTSSGNCYLVIVKADCNLLTDEMVELFNSEFWPATTTPCSFSLFSLITDRFLKNCLESLLAADCNLLVNWTCIWWFFIGISF